MKTLMRSLIVAAVAALALPALAAAADYPPPSNPGTPEPRPGGAKTLKVCKKGGQYKTIQKAVNAARAGDTIRVCNGTYKEGVKVEGAKKQGISIVGNKGNPAKVFINAKGQRHGVIINSANDVTLQGLSTNGYIQNGFFAVNVDGYKMDRLLATGTGVYGLYAFNSVGGEMTNSQAYYHTDAGFYIGQTPKQDKPKRTIVRNVASWGNVLGWSGTNMRYVNITRSYFFNNGTGFVPNTLVSEKYPPEEDNVIENNDIFWNNFNYYKGAPFGKVKPATGSVPYPVGVGILLFGGREHTVSNNRVFGNWGAGVGLIQQLLLVNANADLEKAEAIGPEPWNLKDNRIIGNVMGNGGKDLNGRDLFYDGSGSGNCFSDNQLSDGVANLPDFSTTAFPQCNAPGLPGPANTFNEDAQGQGVGWALALADEKNPAPGGTIAQPFSNAYKGYKPFGKSPQGAYMIWKKGYKAPPVPR
ncbi:MAG: hypothetical protein ACKOQ0_06545 [Solirubrobacterales bacterium]